MILDEIVAQKRRDLAREKEETPLSALEKRLAEKAPPLNFASALQGKEVRLIAEVKKASPSRGLLRPDLDPAALAQTYAAHGAAAISVLTEAHYFQGSLESLEVIRQALGSRPLPLLRKDFLFDPYQIYQARASGADALLLIVAILNQGELHNLLKLTHHLGLEALVEVHDRSELEQVLETEAKVIGINNRDLRTLKVDLRTTEVLRPLIPADRIVVSESGIHTRADVGRLQRCGVQAMLVGEALVTAKDTVAKMRELLWPGSKSAV